MHDVDLLKTKVTNTSAIRRFFGYLPPHGRRLDPDESVEFAGNLLDRIAASGSRSFRDQEALEADLEAGNIEVVLPNPILKDIDTGDVGAVILDTGVLDTVEPTWETSQPA